MPSFGCEHLTKDTLNTIRDRQASNILANDFRQYTCLSCPHTSSFISLDKHYSASKHVFAVAPASVYCAACKDLIYDPSLPSISNPSTNPSLSSQKRKLSALTIDTTAEDETNNYIAANTTTKPCGREGVRGLFNLGETCYMNAVLQTLIHNPILAHYFLGNGHPSHTCPITSRDPDDPLPNAGKRNGTTNGTKGSDDEDDSDAENGSNTADTTTEREQKTCIACAFTELFREAYTVDAPAPTHAVNLLFASWKHIPSMAGKAQQDAQEWFTIIIEKLHDCAVNPSQIPGFNALANGATNGTSKHISKGKQCSCFFHRMFYGRLASEVTCSQCRTSKTMEAEFSSLDLDFRGERKKKRKLLKDASSTESATSGTKKGASAVQASHDSKTSAVPTLQDCLRAYTATEPLTSDDQRINCAKCGERTTASKNTRIRKLPALLAMHVKRFGIKGLGAAGSESKSAKGGGLGGLPEKYEGKLDFPLTIDMASYMVHPHPPKHASDQNGTASADSNTTTATTTGFGRQRRPYLYDLSSVIVHAGEHAHTGHYYAFVKVAVGEGKSMKWFRFDDEIVTATTVEEVLRQEAYLVFYSLRDVPDEGRDDFGEVIGNVSQSAQQQGNGVSRTNKVKT